MLAYILIPIYSYNIANLSRWNVVNLLILDIIVGNLELYECFLSVSVLDEL